MVAVCCLECRRASRVSVRAGWLLEVVRHKKRESKKGTCERGGAERGEVTVLKVAGPERLGDASAPEERPGWCGHCRDVGVTLRKGGRR